MSYRFTFAYVNCGEDNVVITILTWALLVTSFARVAKNKVFRDCST